MQPNMLTWPMTVDVAVAGLLGAGAMLMFIIAILFAHSQRHDLLRYWLARSLVMLLGGGMGAMIAEAITVIIFKGRR